MLIGYARVSTRDQKPDLQIDALREAGCERVFQETASGAKRDRPELRAAVKFMRIGDTLAVWKLDRLARSTRQLLETVEDFEQRGIGLKIITQNIDTTNAGGRLIFTVFSAIAEFEREMIRERTMHGLANARRAGVIVGRKPKLKPAQKAEIVRMIEEGRGTSSTAASLFDVSKTTVKRVLQAHRAGQQGQAA